MKILSATLVALLLAAAPAAAFSVIVDFPNLTYPDGDVTSSSKGCDAVQNAVCTPKN